jgi:hypothetical protein
MKRKKKKKDQVIYRNKAFNLVLFLHILYSFEMKQLTLTMLLGDGRPSAKKKKKKEVFHDDGIRIFFFFNF